MVWAMDAFTVISEPARRMILAELRRGPRNVGALVSRLGMTQPAVSKHLLVLREAGLVSRRGEAQQRIYYLEAEPLREVDAWLEPYRVLWTRHLDALERHLDSRRRKRK